MPHSRTRPLAQPRPQLNEAEPALLHDFFERAVRRFPHRVAIDTPPSPSRPARRTMTYAELDRRSGALAGELREFVTGECVVAILLPRTSEHVYLAQLAVLRAGAAYVCIDPTFPDAQVVAILADARPTVVLTDADGAARVRRLDATVPVVDVPARREPVGRSAPARWLTPSSLAYIIYTSGSTGRPKGVMVEHRAIVNLVRGEADTFPTWPEDRVGQNSSCAYDSSVDEIWMALATGATLVVMDDETTRLGPDLVAWLRNERVTVFSPPPTLLRAIGCADPETALPLLRRVHVGGEPLPQDIADRWSHGRCLVNDYGPTECSVVALRAVVRPGRQVTIGRPVPGLSAWVLDDRLEEAPEGVPGELCLGGVGLARGYLNDPELSARKFVDHPTLGRVYRTGDLAHRDFNGDFICQGRIDAQVKIRGYRIELEAIESVLSACAGVRAAACRVQEDEAGRQIVAFVVPSDPDRLPRTDELRHRVREQLPDYAVPARIGLLAALPTTTSGKLDRRALPALEGHSTDPLGDFVAPRTPAEEAVASAFRRAIGIERPISVDHDFFHVLGGDSLRAAMAISLLREDAATASLTVRDLYDTRTAAGLASRIRHVVPPQFPSRRPDTRTGRPVLATIAQTAWLLAGSILLGPIVYLCAFHGLPEAIRGLGAIPFVLLAPLLVYAGGALSVLAAVGFAVALKWLLIGRYRAMREPVWGWFYVRNWIVTHAVRAIPWKMIDETVFQIAVLRLLGAKIGKRVHIHRGADLSGGGWDLLEIGDDATLSRDVAIRLVEFDDGQVVVGPASIGAGCTLDIRAGLAGHTLMERDAHLAAHSFVPGGGVVPRGESWSGIPAVAAGAAPLRPDLPEGSRELAPWLHGVAVIIGRTLLGTGALLSMMLFVLVPLAFAGADASGVAEWLTNPSLSPGGLLLGAASIVLAVPVSLISRCLTMRTLGRVGEGVVGRWSWGYLRVMLKTDILEGANDWLSGTLLWRTWLRGAGMQVGRNSEFSTITDSIPELIEVGDDSFLADGIYLGGPRIHRGTVWLARTRLGSGVFLGNYAVIPIGTAVPDGVLIGVCTTADPARTRPGTSWFGNPPFELPKREVIEAEVEMTHRPTTARYCRRVFWELLRFTLPLPPAALALAWFTLVGYYEETTSLVVRMFGLVPALDVGAVAALVLLGIALKWSLLGRVRPGTHALWSSWCSRWDFHYTAWHFWGGGVHALEGTLWLSWFLRSLGVKVGRGVVIGDAFALTVDPDMIECEDGATVNALFQAHTFEDRVLKMDRVKIGAGATVGHGVVLLYGADIGAEAKVVGNSVVMKYERLTPGQTYAGCPTRSVE